MTQEGEYLKALPEVNNITRPFWEAVKKHELVLQKCSRCEAFQWYPKAWCERCGSRDMVWTKVCGRGTVYSFTVVRQVVGNSPAFSEDIPFVVAEIELDEGPRMYSNIVGCKPDEVRIGMKVEVTFDDVTPEISLPKFRIQNI